MGVMSNIESTRAVTKREDLKENSQSHFQMKRPSFELKDISNDLTWYSLRKNSRVDGRKHLASDLSNLVD